MLEQTPPVYVMQYSMPPPAAQAAPMGVHCLVTVGGGGGGGGAPLLPLVPDEPLLPLEPEGPASGPAVWPSLGAGTTGSAGCDGSDACVGTPFGTPVGDEDAHAASRGRSKAKDESFMPG